MKNKKKYRMNSWATFYEKEGSRILMKIPIKKKIKNDKIEKLIMKKHSNNKKNMNVGQGIAVGIFRKLLFQDLNKNLRII